MNQSTLSIYVINLERNKERLANIDKFFTQTNIKYNRFSAVDGKSVFSKEDLLRINKIRHSKYPNSKYIMSQGDVGCASSHLEMYNELVNSNSNYFLILEDDVEFDKNFKLFLNQIDKIEDIDFDLLFIGYFASEINDSKKHCQNNAILKFKGKIKLANGFTIGRPAHGLWTTMGYFVSRKGAEKMININADLTLCADELTSDANGFGLNTYALKPPIIYPSPLGFPTETESNHVIQNSQTLNFFKIIWRSILNTKAYIRIKIFFRQF